MKLKHSAKVEAIYHDLQLYSYGSEDWAYIRPNDIGDIKYSIKNSDHYGWLTCDGRSLSRELYSELFAIIGTTYGNNDGTTFKLPDCRGRILGAIGTGAGLTARSAGTLLGSETHTLTVSEMPSHSHGITDPGHSHSYINNTNDQNTDNAFASQTAADNADLAQTTGSSATGITVNSTGGGGAHNNMQPTAFIGHIFIFAKQNVHHNPILA
jgi:microcystin-dependent protein